MEQQNNNVDNANNKQNLSPQEIQQNIIKKLQNGEDPKTFPLEEQQIANQIIKQSKNQQKEINKTIKPYIERSQKGEILTQKDFSELQAKGVPNEILQQIQEQNQQILQQYPPELANFKAKTQEHINSGGARIIRISDTESSPEDLEKILEQNLSISGFNKKTDIVVHAGDLLEAFIDFKHFHHGTQGFLSKRIIKEGNLEGKVAKEFNDSYLQLLEKNGISEYQLEKGELNEQLGQSLQRLYFGAEPNFLNNKDKKEYKKLFTTFKKHLKTAIKNDARNKYSQYKTKFKNANLSPEDLIMVAGNHDVPEIMQEVLGEYMARAGGVSKRKGITFGNPVTGSTGAHLGPDFVDTYGYTDMRERLETIQQKTSEFQDFLTDLNKYIDIDKKELSNLFIQSQTRLAQGIGEGYLIKYHDSIIKPPMDDTIQDMRGKMVTKVPENVDFHLFHGQPNHPSFGGLEERAAYEAIEKAGGGNIIHGHIHGKTTHRMGKNLLLNEGDGKSNFGVYHYDKKKKEVTDIFSQVYNSTLGQTEFEYRNSKGIGVQKDNAQQGQ